MRKHDHIAVCSSLLSVDRYYRASFEKILLSCQLAVRLSRCISDSRDRHYNHAARDSRYVGRDRLRRTWPSSPPNTATPVAAGADPVTRRPGRRILLGTKKKSMRAGRYRRDFAFHYGVQALEMLRKGAIPRMESLAKIF